MTEFPASVSVAYDASDFRALYRACKRCRKNALGMLIGLPAAFTALAYSDGERGMSLLYSAIPYFLIAIATLAAIYFVGPWNSVRARRKYGWEERMAVQLSDEGIITRHPNQDSTFFWPKICDVLVRNSRIFLFTTSSCAIILPRRCFRDDEEFNNWADYARQAWRQSKSAVAE